RLSRARRRRAAAGLGVGTTGGLVARSVLVGGGLLLAIAVLDAGRGVPLAMLILLGFVVAFDWVTTRTGWGRHVFAVGGNAEAARRAGIAVDRVRVLVFTLSATLAACGGILAASRLLAVNQSSGSGDVVLNAIAAAVIGGTSLFGGRGTIWSALLGALVIGSISNGMDLLALASSVKFMITGGVLLAAVTIDAVSRRGRQAAGRAWAQVGGGERGRGGQASGADDGGVRQRRRRGCSRVRAALDHTARGLTVDRPSAQ